MFRTRMIAKKASRVSSIVRDILFEWRAIHFVSSTNFESFFLLTFSWIFSSLSSRYPYASIK